MDRSRQTGAATMPLSEAEGDLIERLYRGGASVQSISRDTGRHKSTVHHTLQKRGVAKRRKMCERMDDRQKDFVVAEYLKGRHAGPIGRQMGCSSGTVYLILKERGVKRRTREAIRDVNDDRGGFEHLPRAVFRARKRRAQQMGHVWAITVEDIEAIYQRQNGLCYYTGVPMKTAARLRDYDENLRGDPLTVSIDRRDSSKGYLPDNVVLCARWVNYAKNAFSESQFVALLRQAADSLNRQRGAEPEDSVTA